MISDGDVDLTFGPVPSRRLGRSLGINNIPPKICSYACVYCQVGKTLKMQVERKPFFSAKDIVRSVEERVDRIKKQKETIDYLCFVPDGEPTLDINLGTHIDALKALGIPVAVISNGSLIDQASVQDDLLEADWVSLKVDAVNESLWREINRPHRKLNLNQILDGMKIFRQKFDGILATETMLIKDINDSEEACREVSRFLAELQPDIAYLSIPTRPPAEQSIHTADPRALNRAFQCVASKVQKVEILSGYEGNAFSSTGDVQQDILNITAVHPMRKEAVMNMLDRENADWHIINELVRSGQLAEADYNGHVFYLRSF